LRAARPANYKRAVTDLAIVCDFDGTATLLDVGDEISKRFGGRAHFDLQKALFAKGELTTRGIIQGIYTHVRAPESEVCAFAVEAARLRPGFEALVRAARDASAPFILASGGLRQYIEAVLAAHLPADLRAHVQVRANEGVFGDGGLKVRFPGDEASRRLGCEECGSCKRVSVADARAAGAKFVLGLGDGFADRCLVQFADRTFARQDSYLHKHCLERGLPHTPFTEMYEAAELVRRHG
jgi:2-hydroxy-3-keto-5-methylthiopentenyl-1-phosphate phosphatase